MSLLEFRDFGSIRKFGSVLSAMRSGVGLEGPLGRLFAVLDPLKTGFVKAEDIPKALTGLGTPRILDDLFYSTTARYCDF